MNSAFPTASNGGDNEMKMQIPSLGGYRKDQFWIDSWSGIFSIIFQIFGKFEIHLEHFKPKTAPELYSGPDAVFVKYM